MDNIKQDRQTARREKLLNKPIHKVIPEMALPTIVSMLIMSLYNMADTFFVSKLGTTATGAVGINFSLMMVIQSLGMSIAVGAGSYISRLLGAKRDQEAAEVMSTAFFTALGVGVVITVLGLIFMHPLVRLMGASESVAPYAIDYAKYILYSAAFMSGSYVLNQCLRAEGSATFSMIGMVSGAILNVILDPIFIFTFGWGIAGAAIATALSNVVSFCVLLYPFIKKHSLLKLSAKNISYKKDIVIEISKMGFPTLIRTGLMSVSTVVTNNFASGFSDSALAAISVVNRFMMLIGSALIGFGQGFQPVAGYNWGAKRYDRVWKAFWFCTYVAIIGMSAISAIIYIFAPQILSVFTKTDQSIIDIGSFSIRLQCIAMPIHAWVIIVNMLFTALGRATNAAILSLSRQALCFIPSVIVLSLLFGVWGLAAAQAVADTLSLLIALPLAIKILKELKSLLSTTPEQEVKQ